ncbi:hypothetical protein O3P69_010239 [Scylla paramamosain]|uniref:Uncharacterized protein n=1 Tax=Scylla paramamosain TaxID=85552 RepID=A0AAW0TTE5_SCYPA
MVLKRCLGCSERAEGTREAGWRGDGQRDIGTQVHVRCRLSAPHASRHTPPRQHNDVTLLVNVMPKESEEYSYYVNVQGSPSTLTFVDEN